MFLIAHHVGVELFGREYSPRTPLEHACVFGALALVLFLAAYGAWTLVNKVRMNLRARAQV